MSRKKSFRKSLRESFRRLRRGRSQRSGQQQAGSISPDSSATQAPPPGRPVGGFGRATTGIRSAASGNSPAAASNDTAQQAAAAHRNLHSGERQVEPKIELSSIVKCISLTSAVITSNLSLFKPSLWIGTNSGSVLVYSIDLASEQQQQQQQQQQQASSGQSVSSGGDAATTTDSSGPISSDAPAEGSKTTAKLVKEIQLKHKAPIIAIFTSPEEPKIAQQQQVAAGAIAPTSSSGEASAKSTPEKQTNSSELLLNGEAVESAAETNEGAPPAPPSPIGAESGRSPGKKDIGQQARVLICSEEQFKVFNLPNLKPFCKFKLTAHEGLRAKKISITQFLKPSVAASSHSSKGQQQQQQSAALVASSLAAASSKSLQSFATQTSPPGSPAPPATGEPAEASDEQQTANGATGSAKASSGKLAESNNNSLSTLNNNHTNTATSGRQQQQQQDKELLNAKFGAKANPTAGAAATTANDHSNEQVGELGGAATTLEPYMICMSNQGDCAIYSVPDLKRQAQIQVCKREDVNGITSAMLTNYGEGYYLKSSSNFLRFSISSQRVLRVLSVV